MKLFVHFLKTFCIKELGSRYKEKKRKERTLFIYKSKTTCNKLSVKSIQDVIRAIRENIWVRNVLVAQWSID